MNLAEIVVDDFSGSPVAEHNMPCAVCGNVTPSSTSTAACSTPAGTARGTGGSRRG